VGGPEMIGHVRPRRRDQRQLHEASKYARMGLCVQGLAYDQGYHGKSRRGIQGLRAAAPASRLNSAFFHGEHACRPRRRPQTNGLDTYPFHVSAMVTLLMAETTGRLSEEGLPTIGSVPSGRGRTRIRIESPGALPLPLIDRMGGWMNTSVCV
jgi:hypothetical protein